jgi:hypothetical protein
VFIFLSSIINNSPLDIHPGSTYYDTRGNKPMTKEQTTKLKAVQRSAQDISRSVTEFLKFDAQSNFGGPSLSGLVGDLEDDTASLFANLNEFEESVGVYKR